MSTDSSEVIFFLGAGASVHAGVPDTFGIVEEFLEFIKENRDQYATVKKIIEVLQNHQPELNLIGKQIDVELLLESLERLEKKERELVLWFHNPSEYLLSNYPLKRPLNKELQNFIRKLALVRADSIRYLEPLLEFIEEHRPFDVFSVNYDTCIEQFCEVNGKSMQDGFDPTWNFGVFKRDVDVRLYKLHGSVTWYKTDRGDYLKIPIQSREATLTLTSGERAESLVLFPVQKWEYAEPMLELLVELKKT